MIKQWILKTFFSKELEEATINGSKDAFHKAHADIMETMKDDTDKKAKELADRMLANLLTPVDMNKIVMVDKTKGIVYVGENRIDDNRLANLKAEAEFFEASDLWHLIQETPKELAHKAMFVAGDSIDDMKKGRSILYTLSSQKNMLDLFKSYVAKK